MSTTGAPSVPVPVTIPDSNTVVNANLTRTTTNNGWSLRNNTGQTLYVLEQTKGSTAPTLAVVKAAGAPILDKESAISSFPNADIYIAAAAGAGLTVYLQER